MDVGTLLLLASLSSPVTRAGVPASVPVSQPATGAAAVAWSVDIEARRDRFDYRFENPSSFDTAELVPHFFEQRYDADNLWLTGRVRYRLGGRPLETEGGFTAETTGLASDYDTFFQPDGNVVVYGTTADTDLMSWRVAQYVGLGSWNGVQARVGYSYRRDRSDYHASYTTTTQTKPPSSSSFWNTDRETTISEVHEIRFGVERAFEGPRWLARVTADTAPTTLARLTTILPDKYDEPVVFMAKGFTLDVRLAVAARLGRWLAGAAVSYVRTWNYQQASQFHRDGAGVSVTIGR
jgi:hypothetical protein